MLKVEGLDVIEESGVTVLSVGPRFAELDEPMMNELRDPLVSAALSANPPVILIDLEHTQFFGTVFIEAVFQIWSKIELLQGARLALCSLTEHCREVIDITRLDNLWELYDSRDEAMQALA